MFWRQLGRKVLLLHSYRDGEGKVRQSRLAHFEDVPELQAMLESGGWEAWRRRIESTYSDCKGNWEQLLRKAQEMAGTDPLKPPHGRRRVSAPKQDATGAEIRSVLRRLASLIGGEMDRASRAQFAAELEDLRVECLGERHAALPDAEVLVQQGRLERAREVLEGVLRHNRRGVSGGRRCFEPRDESGKERLRALEMLAGVLQQLNEGESAADVWRQRVRCSADPDALVEYGGCLQRLGRLDEAARQYTRLPNADPRRHFHLAAVRWEMGDSEMALEDLLRGLLRDREVGEQLRVFQKSGTARGYWQRYGSIWNLGARRFFENVYKEPSVRFALSRAAERRHRPRQLLPAYTRHLLLERSS